MTNVEAMVANGNTAGGGLLALRDTGVTQVSERLFDVELTADQEAGFEYDSAGSVVESSQPATYHMSVSVIYDGGWTVRGVDTEVTQ